MKKNRSVFDYNDGDYLYGSGNTRFDSEGHMNIQMGNNMSMDMDTGELHITSNWENNSYSYNDDDDDDGWN